MCKLTIELNRIEWIERKKKRKLVELNLALVNQMELILEIIGDTQPFWKLINLLKQYFPKLMCLNIMT